MMRWALISTLVALSFTTDSTTDGSYASGSQVRMRVNVAGTGGGGGTTFSQSDFTYLGFFEVPTGNMPNTGTGDSQVIGFRNVSGTVHAMISQNCCHVTGAAGGGSIYEYADPGSYGSNLGTAPHGTFIKNWGTTTGATGGPVYDMWHGRLGTTVCLSTTPWGDPNTLTTCSPGATGINIGQICGGGVCGPSNYTVHGLQWHDDGSGTCCAYITYGQGYSNYSPDYNVVVANLSSPGANTAWGPFRTCSGTYGTGGTGGQTCGGMRGLLLWDMPDGSMGIGGGPGFWQQSTDNKGPSIFWGSTWPSSSTTQGFGSTRGTAAYRTTDIVSPNDALALYSLDNNIAHDGSIISGPNITFRRTTDATWGTYVYDDEDNPEQIDPQLYGGVGGWTSVDYLEGAVYVNSSPKSGMLFSATLATDKPANNSGSHVWYQTQAGHLYQVNGTGPTLIFQRNALEAVGCTYHTGDPNATLEYDSKPAFYTNVVANAVTVNYANPGVPNASQSISVSGNNITIHLRTNGSSQSTTTANDVITLITGNSTANALVSVSTTGTHGLCQLPASDGTGAVDTLGTVDGTKKLGGDDSTSGQVSAGVWTYGNGPLYCLNHNVPTPFSNTGPVGTHFEPALIVYSTSKVQAAPGSGNPDYSLDPESTIYFHNINASMLFNGGGNTFVNETSGMYFDAVANKLYVGAPFVDNQTYFGFNMPIVHVFSVATSAPAPLAASVALPLAALLAVARRRRP